MDSHIKMILILLLLLTLFLWDKGFMIQTMPRDKSEMFRLRIGLFGKFRSRCQLILLALKKALLVVPLELH